MDKNRQQVLSKLPGVDRVLELAKADSEFSEIPKTVLVDAARHAIANIRSAILNDSKAPTKALTEEDAVLRAAGLLAKKFMALNLRRVVNATGIIIHTNLGRSLLSQAAIDNVMSVASRYSNLEYDLAKGVRGSRFSAVEDIICRISGAESALVVNNNAGAVLLSLDTLARGKKVIVSRGELVEIGGSFRIPDIMAKSGCILKEVGTTNRTHLKDYETAIENETGLLLKVHTSNYSIVGFSKSVDIETLVSLGAKYRLPVMEDLGSGTLIDFSAYGLSKEPTVQESVKSGPDIITFSGDKLLGGPQAGFIVGKKNVVDQIKRNPMARALRIDKMTLAAVEATLRLYLDEKKTVSDIPTLWMMTRSLQEISRQADRLADDLESIDRLDLEVTKCESVSKAGGGSLPLLELPTWCIAVRSKTLSANRMEQSLRSSEIPIIGRIEDDVFIMDLRTVQEDDMLIIQKAFVGLGKRAAS